MINLTDRKIKGRRQNRQTEIKWDGREKQQMMKHKDKRERDNH